MRIAPPGSTGSYADAASGQNHGMSGPDLVLVLRYRKAVTYGLHVLLGALGEHRTATRYEVRFGESVEETARHIRDAGGARVLVLWSF
jgi:hypothetical protein